MPPEIMHNFYASILIICRAWYDCRYTMIMMPKPMKAQTEWSNDPVPNNNEYITESKQILRQIQTSY